jgi:hypothetical protein
LYNEKGPHSSQGEMTPSAFEQAVEKMDKNLRPKMQIYQWNHELLTKPFVFNKRKKYQKRKSQPISGMVKKSYIGHQISCIRFPVSDV